jgi:hypothetical protein
MNAPATTSIREEAQRMAKLLGVECFPLVGKAPVFDGIPYAWQKNAINSMGLHDAGYYEGRSKSLWNKANSYGMTGNRLWPVDFLDVDNLDLAYFLIDRCPFLEDTFQRWRGFNNDEDDNGDPVDDPAFEIETYAFGFETDSPLPVTSFSVDGHEHFSYRKHGEAYIVGPGVLHYWDVPKGSKNWVLSGCYYDHNGLRALHLTHEQTDQLAQALQNWQALHRKTITVAAPKSSQPRTIALSDDCDQMNRVLFNLTYIPANLPGQQWIGVLGNIKDILGDSGYDIAYTWSATAPDKFKPKDWPKVWEKRKKSVDAETAARGLSKLANTYSGKQAARDWFARQKPAPTMSTQVDIRVMDAADLASNENRSADYPAGYPDNLRLCVRTFWKHAGNTVNDVLQFIIEQIGRDPFTRTDIVERSRFDSRKVYRAFDYGLDRLLLRIDTFPSDLPHHVEDIHGKSVKKPDAAENQGAIFQLPATYADLRTIILNNVVVPRIEDKYSLPHASIHRLHALGVDGDPELVTAINAQIDGALTADEKRQDRTIRNQAIKEYKHWQHLLADTTVTPAPVLPDGTAVKPSDALVVSAALSNFGKRDTWRKAEINTGATRKTIIRKEQKYGITHDQVYHPTGRIVASAADLPPMEFDKAMEGYPARAVNDDGELFDLRSSEGRKQAAQSDGPLKIDYSQGIVRRWLTADEKQALADAPAQPRKAYTQPQDRRESASEQIHVGPGSDPAKARRWLSWCEIITKQPDNPDLTIRQRVYRLAGREEPMFIALSEPTVYEPPQPAERESDPPEPVTCNTLPVVDAPEPESVPDTTNDLRPMYGPWPALMLATEDQVSTFAAKMARQHAELMAKRTAQQLMAGD